MERGTLQNRKSILTFCPSGLYIPDMLTKVSRRKCDLPIGQIYFKPRITEVSPNGLSYVRLNKFSAITHRVGLTAIGNSMCVHEIGVPSTQWQFGLTPKAHNINISGTWHERQRPWDINHENKVLQRSTLPSVTWVQAGRIMVYSKPRISRNFAYLG